MATRTITGVTAYRDAGALVSKATWTDVGATNQGLSAVGDGLYLTKASSSDTSGSNYLNTVALRLGLVDPRPSLPAGYTNFQVVSLQVGVYDKLDITSVAGGQVLAQLNCRIMYTGDTWWTTPRVTIKQLGLGASPRNTYAWDTLTWTPAQINLSATVGSSGIPAAQTLSADRLFAGTAANQTVGPILIATMSVGAGTKVGTWYLDGLRMRVNYSYDLQVPQHGASIGARHFFDYR